MAKHFLLCESFAARSRRIGRCNGFDALRLLLATGIAAFHGFTVARGGVAGMPEPMQAAARLILPAFFVMSGYLVATSLARARGVRVISCCCALYASCRRSSWWCRHRR